MAWCHLCNSPYVNGICNCDPCRVLLSSSLYSLLKLCYTYPTSAVTP